MTQAPEYSAPFNVPPTIFGMNGLGDWTRLFDAAGKPGWALVEQVLDLPTAPSGNTAAAAWARSGNGVMTRLINDEIDLAGKGGGSIPHPGGYDEFAQRCANYVRAAPDCHIWFIGNEPNIYWHWPNDGGEAVPIEPRHFARCFNMVREAIKTVRSDYWVIPSAVSPVSLARKNGASLDGRWEPFMRRYGAGADERDILLDALEWNRELFKLIDDVDGIDIHTYWPPDAENERPSYYSYRQMMGSIPTRWRDKPVFISEARPDSDGWPEESNGWMQKIYAEINRWNHLRGSQKIYGLLPYRWGAESNDRWRLAGRTTYETDLSTALAYNYTWESDAPAAESSPISLQQAAAKLVFLEKSLLDIETDAVVSPTSVLLGVRGKLSLDLWRRLERSTIRELKELGPVPVGEAVVSAAGSLPARHILHLPMPIDEGLSKEVLADGIHSILRLADRLGDVRSIAFPAVGTDDLTGIHPTAASEATLETILEFLQAGSPLETVFLSFIDQKKMGIYQDTFAKIAGVENEVAAEDQPLANIVGGFSEGDSIVQIYPPQDTDETESMVDDTAKEESVGEAASLGDRLDFETLADEAKTAPSDRGPAFAASAENYEARVRLLNAIPDQLWPGEKLTLVLTVSDVGAAPWPRDGSVRFGILIEDRIFKEDAYRDEVYLPWITPQAAGSGLQYIVEIPVPAVRGLYNIRWILSAFPNGFFSHILWSSEEAGRLQVMDEQQIDEHIRFLKSPGNLAQRERREEYDRAFSVAGQAELGFTISEKLALPALFDLDREVVRKAAYYLYERREPKLESSIRALFENPPGDLENLLWLANTPGIKHGFKKEVRPWMQDLMKSMDEYTPLELFEARVTILNEVPDQLWPDEVLLLTVLVENSGSRDWSKLGIEEAALYVTITEVDDPQVERYSGENQLKGLPAGPGEQIETTVKLPMPAEEGSYFIVWELRRPLPNGSVKSFWRSTDPQRLIIMSPKDIKGLIQNLLQPSDMKKEERLAALDRAFDQSLQKRFADLIISELLMPALLDRDREVVGKAASVLYQHDPALDSEIRAFLAQHVIELQNLRDFTESADSSRAWDENVQSWIKELLPDEQVDDEGSDEKAYTKRKTGSVREEEIGEKSPTVPTHIDTVDAADKAQSTKISEENKTVAESAAREVAAKAVIPSAPIIRHTTNVITIQGKRALETLESGNSVEISVNAKTVALRTDINGRKRSFRSNYQVNSTKLLALEKQPAAYGEHLFNGLINEAHPTENPRYSTARGYQYAQDSAGSDGYVIQLSLDPNDQDLHKIKWEYIDPPDNPEENIPPLATSAKFPFYRLLPGPNGSTESRLAKPLKILVAICNPANLNKEEPLLGLEPLDLTVEREIIEPTISVLKKANVAETTILGGNGKPATWRAIREEIAKGIDILHIVAHGIFLPMGFSLVVESEDNPGKHTLVETAMLQANLSSAGRSPRLVILAACDSALDNTGLVLQGMGPRLVKSGVPAVIAMQQKLAMTYSQWFNRYFYDHLARTGSVDVAMAATRQALYEEDQYKFNWATPVLFMGSSNGKLFDTDTGAAQTLPDLSSFQPKTYEEIGGNGDPRLRIAQGQMDAVAQAYGVPYLVSALRQTAEAEKPLAEPQQRNLLAMKQVAINARQLETEIKKKTDAFPALEFEPSVYTQIASSLNAGKHIVLTGPPGTGKTTLAQKLCALAKSTNMAKGATLTTATTDWTTFDTIGGFVPTKNQTLQFRPGIFLEAIREAKWLVIDEMNRAEIDKAFGELFTVLSGQAVELPYKVVDSEVRILPAPSKWPYDAKLDYDYVVHPSWRIIGTMNVYDKSYLFQMSFAFMRRFAFIDVGLPAPDIYKKLCTEWLDDYLHDDHKQEKDLTPLEKGLNSLFDLQETSDSQMMQHRAIGPAIAQDVIRYIGDRSHQVASLGEHWLPLEAFGEAIMLYISPQLDGLERVQIKAIYEQLCELFWEQDVRDALLQRLRLLYPHLSELWQPIEVKVEMSVQAKAAKEAAEVDLEEEQPETAG